MYQTEFDGKHHELGTSGFLYRSNKLMYDHETKSMWSTLEGEPVVGPLVGKGIKLQSEFLVTTTWGEWKARHPETTVLSLDTGHRRNYDEGVAYAQYFGTDDLMFHTPKLDKRLKNKAEVLVLRNEIASDNSAPPLAMSSKFLDDNPVYHDESGGRKFVVLTDESGANRIYESKDHVFKTWDGTTLIDASKTKWTVREGNLTSPDGVILKRLAAHRVFWFGWYAQFPETRLVK